MEGFTLNTVLDCPNQTCSNSASSMPSAPLAIVDANRSVSTGAKLFLKSHLCCKEKAMPPVLIAALIPDFLLSFPSVLKA